MCILDVDGKNPILRMNYSPFKKVLNMLHIFINTFIVMCHFVNRKINSLYKFNHETWKLLLNQQSWKYCHNSRSHESRFRLGLGEYRNKPRFLNHVNKGKLQILSTANSEGSLYFFMLYSNSRKDLKLGIFPGIYAVPREPRDSVFSMAKKDGKTEVWTQHLFASII